MLKIVVPPSRLERLTCGLGIGSSPIHNCLQVSVFGFVMRSAFHDHLPKSTHIFWFGCQLAVKNLALE